MPARLKINWLWSWMIWTGIGLVLLGQSYATTKYPSGPEAFEEWIMDYWMIYMQMTRAWLWWLLTPVVFELRRRIPFKRWWFPFGVLLHFAFAACLIVWTLQVRMWIWMPLTLDWFPPFYTLEGLVAGIGARGWVDAVIYMGVLTAGYIFDAEAQRNESIKREQELRLQLAETAVQQGRLRSELVQAEMKALKQQLHPHFLFNALNAISGLVRRNDQPRALDALLQLSTLLRALIGSAGQPVVPLDQELGYCRNYLLIEKLRFDDRLIFEFEIADDVTTVPVPTLLLQPMVENAIKHGIARRRNPGTVTIRAARVGELLQITILNDPAELARGVAVPASHGIGLTTTRQRLQRVYGGEFRLECVVRPPERTVLIIEIPFVMKIRPDDGDKIDASPYENHHDTNS